MEKNYTANLTEQASVKLAVKALLEVVESGSKNVEVAVLKFQQPLRLLNDDEVDQYVTEIEKEKQAGTFSIVTKKDNNLLRGGSQKEKEIHRRYHRSCARLVNHFVFHSVKVVQKILQTAQ